MAAESVIVQVEKEEEVTTTPLSTASTTSKKIKAPNFFRKLFCCLRPHNHRHTVQAAQNGAPINQITLLDHLTINEIVVDQSNEVALLKSVTTDFEDKQCLVIDLDETLVHSSFAPVQNADFTIPVEIDGTVHQVYVSKRPYVDEFLQHVGRLFECVLFTASLLDKWGCFKHRLFRESCVFHRGSYVKDLSRLGRDVNNTVILDNSPASYMFHPKHAVPIPSWFDDQNDTSLLELMVFFERMATSSLKAVDFLRENDVQGEHLELFTGEPAPHDSDTDSIIHTTQTSNSIITSVTSPTS